MAQCPHRRDNPSGLDICAISWRRYMTMMDQARSARDILIKRRFYHDARIYLDDHFEAIERELDRNMRLKRI